VAWNMSLYCRCQECVQIWLNTCLCTSVLRGSKYRVSFTFCVFVPFPFLYSTYVAVRNLSEL
jgi:hypothetical protein